ncbi:MAG: heparinase II/III family protein [Clostridia bacterium]|nr:heparinase II/III family protein [Clostridia bacterium]
MKQLKQQRTAGGQVFPSPRPDEVMYESPPTFCFLYENGAKNYTIAVRQNDHIIWQGKTKRNFITPDCIFPPGRYEWNLYTADAERGWQAYEIAPQAVKWLRPSAREIYDAVPDERPRHLFCKDDIPKILQTHQAALETLQNNIAVAYEDGMPEPPRFHRDPDALPYREYFGRHRDFCDRNLVACALGWLLLDDKKAGEHARNPLLTICDWNSEGPCSLEGPWGDEVGLSHARCLPAVFDLCFDLLSEKERIFVARTVAAYAYQCERRLNQIDFCQNPGNSHAGRLPAYLGEAALVLKGLNVVPEDVLIRWLSYAVDVYSGIFPYFGGPDGGWAEGTFYATSYTKWYLPFFSAVERFSGVSFLRRPFYQRLIRFFQHFCPPGWELHPFADGYWCNPDDAEWPGFFAQNPYHIYAERFGDLLMQKWSRDAQKQKLFKLHLLDIFLPCGDPAPDSLAGGITRACAFPDAGFISLHTDPENSHQELALLARSSRYGSVSHQHADQGSFALLAGGTALICPSGYFGRQYGTKHHREWTNQTKAHNTLLVNGEGQETFSHMATGKVLYARDDADGVLRGAIDPSDAYEHIIAWTRSFELTDDRLLITDHVELDSPQRLDYLLHSMAQPIPTGNDLHLRRNGWRLDIHPQEGDLHSPVVSDQFETDLNAEEPAAYHVSMPAQYHMRWQTPVRQVHNITVLMNITKQSKKTPD